jgi:hypothetical protein
MKARVTFRHARGFTLLELMAAIFISILIIGALYQVFSRVQNMFRTGHNQTKVLERGRAMMDMIVRDLEMMCAAEVGPSTENLNARDFGVEYWQEGIPYKGGNVAFNEVDRTYHVCLKPHSVAETGNGPGTDFWRRLRPGEYHVLLPHKDPILPGEKFYGGDFFFLGRDRDWHSFGYGLYSAEGSRVPNQVAGSLYRHHEVLEHIDIPGMIQRHNSRAGNLLYQKVADGVVHLRLRAISAMDPGRAPWHEPIFYGAHVPLYVEVEFGLLEDNVVLELEAKAEEFAPADPKRYAAQMEILEANLDKVHMFRQLVPIRNSRYFGFDPSRSAMTDLMIFRTRGINTRIEGEGDRFVFIIDQSGSMRSDNRIGVASEALIKTLGNLESGKKFYVYFFGHESKPMDRADLVEATQQNVNSIIPWIQGMPANGGATKPEESLKDAFKNKKPTTIWLLTDGRFSGGASVAELIENLNIDRGVRVNTIGFARRESQVGPVLREIADQNSGTYNFIESGGN